MATWVHGGVRAWSGKRDSEGYREFKVKVVVASNTKEDGPFTVLLTPGLPTPGVPWIFGNDVDLWSWCRPDCTIEMLQQKDGEPSLYWGLEFTFSNKPLDRKKERCQDIQIEDPLLEPPKVSGSFTTYTEEAIYDRFGNPIATSSHEQIRGPQVEFDAGRSVVKIEQNVPVLQLALCDSMKHTVNQFPLWGLPARFIKLSNFSWDRHYHGTCSVYYKRSFEFEAFSRPYHEPTLTPGSPVDPEDQIYVSGWDRDILDEGTKVLHGRWGENGGWELLPINEDGDGPDYTNPSHFSRFKDRNGENARVILDGFGIPVGGQSGTATDIGSIHVEKYDESDFLLLGIPVDF